MIWNSLKIVRKFETNYENVNPDCWWRVPHAQNFHLCRIWEPIQNAWKMSWMRQCFMWIFLWSYLKTNENGTIMDSMNIQSWQPPGSSQVWDSISHMMRLFWSRVICVVLVWELAKLWEGSPHCLLLRATPLLWTCRSFAVVSNFMNTLLEVQLTMRRSTHHCWWRRLLMAWFRNGSTTSRENLHTCHSIQIWSNGLRSFTHEMWCSGDPFIKMQCLWCGSPTTFLNVVLDTELCAGLGPSIQSMANGFSWSVREVADLWRLKWHMRRWSFSIVILLCKMSLRWKMAVTFPLVRKAWFFELMWTLAIHMSKNLSDFWKQQEHDLTSSSMSWRSSNVKVAWRRRDSLRDCRLLLQEHMISMW